MVSQGLRRLSVAVFAGCIASSPAFARTITIAWDPNPEPDIAGYIVYNGSACGAYTQQVRIGNQTVYTFSNLPDAGPYCFAVQAVNTAGEVSPLSDPLFFDPAGTLALDKTLLNFAGAILGTGFASETGAQRVTILRTPPASPAWTVQSNAGWVNVGPASGSGPGSFLVSVTSGAPITGGQATVTVTSGGATASVAVTFKASPTTRTGPFGSMDSPVANMPNGLVSTPVTGSLAVGGWALDDVEVKRVAITRDAVPPEPYGAQVFIGDAVFVDGARPDVLAAYPNSPFSSRAGWGLMVLTNMLPSQGNGQFTLHATAYDANGNATEIGSRTINCTNATATAPFGTIDLPAQGETVSGSAYPNFGWALAPPPNAIPTDGSTISVFIDGVRLGSVTYNNYRSDIAALFPGLANTNGAVGYRAINTTTLANGLHTIAWTVADTAGNTSGIGSRYFNVQNGGAAVTAASVTTAAVAAAPAATAPVDDAVSFRVGFDENQPLQPAARSGDSWFVQVDPASRLELHLPSAGYHATTPLPAGAQLDKASGVFYWQPGPAFMGLYDLSFADGARHTAVRVDVRPAADPLVVIDLPAREAHSNRFVIAGWALDPSARVDSGIATLHVWAYKDSGEPPIFLGVAQHGGARPDVAAVYGPHAAHSGYGLEADLAEPGGYTIAVFPFVTSASRFGPAQTVHVVVP